MATRQAGICLVTHRTSLVHVACALPPAGRPAQPFRLQGRAMIRHAPATRS
ncbi:hypothetical protein SXCC_04441 [Gluconacetobacter sp. SXCC-1]|nr:hypothetical protein SXCC_04441 [Gluconacetobacter sp. SXCC-1]